MWLIKPTLWETLRRAFGNASNVESQESCIHLVLSYTARAPCRALLQTLPSSDSLVPEGGMNEDPRRPQINASKLIVGGGFLGAIFAAASAAIFLIGIPTLRVMFPAAIVLGLGIALVLRFRRHKTTGAPWLLSAIQNPKEAPTKREPKENPSEQRNRHLPMLLARGADGNLHVLAEGR